MQHKLDPYLSMPKSRPLDPEIPHRDIILFLLQLGIPITERGLLRATRQEIRVMLQKGRKVSYISLHGLQRHLYQLARENLVIKFGHCWALRN